MAKKVFNMQGGLHSAAAYSALENRAWGSCVADVASLVVTPAAGMNLNISTGDGLISVDNFNARRIQVTAAETVAVPAADATYNRLDSVVAYINTSVTPTTSVVDNTNNILMFAVVPGTAAATPTAPSGAAIQLAIGAGNPYMVLYNVLVPQGATNTAGVTLTDLRKVIGIITPEQLPTDIVTTPKIKDKAVTSSKIDFTTLPPTKVVSGSSAVNNGPDYVSVSTTYPFIANQSYLIMFRSQMSRTNDTGTVFEYRLQVGGSTVSTGRIQGDMQRPDTIIAVYTASSTSTATTRVISARLAGSTTFNVELPVLSIAPIAYVAP